MRIPIATTVICSTLSTFAFYQGFVALFSSTSHPDDESATNNQDAAKSEQAKAKAKPTIAKPEMMASARNQIARAKAERAQKAKQLATANGTIASRNLPTISVPGTPMPRSASAIEEERLQASGRSTTQSASSVAPPETIASAQTTNADSGSSLPFSTSTAPLSDVKGHWAQSYVESLASKGIVRGFLDGNFHPDEPVTARQFATMAQKAFAASPITYGDLQRSSGDRIPTRADAAALIYQTLAKANPAPVVTAVQVSGAVPRPGIYTMPTKNEADPTPDPGLPTVTRAIQRAGGALTGADLRQVQIHRVGDTTARQIINVDVERMLATGDRSRDIVLQQGDKLFIPAATAASNPQPRALPTPEPTVSLVNRVSRQ